MSSDSDSSDASPRKRRKKIKICFQDHASNQSDESDESHSQEPVIKLTSLVRETYLSYLIKMLSRHYKSTNKESSEIIFSDRDIEQCALRMEQKALRSSIGARWYQRAMLRMVAKIKQQAVSVPKVQSKLFAISNHSVISHAINRRPPQIKRLANNGIHINKEEISQQIHSVENEVELLFHSYSESDGSDHHDEIEKAYESDLITKPQSSASSAGTNGTEEPTNPNPAQTLDERLEALKFGRLTEYAVRELSPGNENDEIDPTDVLFQEYSDNENDKIDNDMPQKSPKSPGLSSLDRQLAEIHGETGEEPPMPEETVKEDELKPKKRIAWQKEERYYTKRLRLKLRSLTTAKRLKIQHRLNELFVKGGKNVAATLAFDPLLQFKDRIKPWVVKHLMPHYKNGGKITTRDFFKHIARNVTDNLIATNLLPDEADVIAHINLVFNS